MYYLVATTLESFVTSLENVLYMLKNVDQKITDTLNVVVIHCLIYREASIRKNEFINDPTKTPDICCKNVSF